MSQAGRDRGVMLLEERLAAAAIRTRLAYDLATVVCLCVMRADAHNQPMVDLPPVAALPLPRDIAAEVVGRRIVALDLELVELGAKS